MKAVIVSACLLGLETRYDGRNCRRRQVVDLITSGNIIPVPVCPEQLGGLPTPRAPSEITAGDGFSILDGDARILASTGEDVTQSFIRGAEAALRIAQLSGAKRALLKGGSPSCGAGAIRRGDETVSGFGVTAALLKRAGLEIEEIE